MEKQINFEWANTLMNENAGRKEIFTERPSYDWVQNNKGFKKSLRFKVIAANSQENNIFSWIVGQHWFNTIDESRQGRFVCPEKTLHLKKLNIECPICAAKRRLLAKGFKDIDLTIQGKFGPIPMFDPQTTSNVKVVVMESDTKNDWDQSHISILQQRSDFLTKWLVEKYMDTDTPNFLDWERSNCVKFSRASENGRWERDISFSIFEPSQDVLAKLKEENETIYMPDLWKMPTDDEFLAAQTLANEKVNELLKAKETMNVAATVDDDIPF